MSWSALVNDASGVMVEGSGGVSISLFFSLVTKFAVIVVVYIRFMILYVCICDDFGCAILIIIIIIIIVCL